MFGRILLIGSLAFIATRLLPTLTRTRAALATLRIGTRMIGWTMTAGTATVAAVATLVASRLDICRPQVSAGSGIRGYPPDSSRHRVTAVQLSARRTAMGGRSSMAVARDAATIAEEIVMSGGISAKAI